MGEAGEVPFLDAIKHMTDEELARKRRFYLGCTDSISMRHRRAVCDEIARRRKRKVE